MVSKQTTFALFSLSMLAGPLSKADDFTGFSMDFVNVGDAGNAADDTGYGAVGYNYRMGTYEVSRGMIDSYNGSGGGPVISMSDMSSLGGNGVDKPATGVSWNEAARFVNWLNTSSGYSAAYKFTTGGANDNIVLWSAGDAGFDAANPFRNTEAHYFLPSEDEWYKAAYYDGDAGVYYDYATGSDSAPTAVGGGTAGGTAVYSQSFSNGPAVIGNAGGLSPYGTMAQNGNVMEWGEGGYNAPNDSGVESRALRGGYWNDFSLDLESSYRHLGSPSSENLNVGFRVAAVPEPSSTALIGLGAFSLLLRRKRG